MNLRRPARYRPVRARWHSSAVSLFAACLFLGACASTDPESEPVSLIVTHGGERYGLRLVAAGGVRINARLKPVLELGDGAIVRLDSRSITPDSAYFAEPPVASIAVSGQRLTGTLRVSVCVENASYCQSLILPVDQALPRS